MQFCMLKFKYVSSSETSGWFSGLVFCHIHEIFAPTNELKPKSIRKIPRRSQRISVSVVIIFCYGIDTPFKDSVVN